MSRRQKRALWIGILVAVVMGLFPPWVQEFESEMFVTERPGSYGFILDPLPPPNSRWGSRIDYGRLAVQSTLVLLVTTGGAVVTLGSKEEEDEAASDSGSPPAES